MLGLWSCSAAAMVSVAPQIVDKDGAARVADSATFQHYWRSGRVLLAVRYSRPKSLSYQAATTAYLR